VPATALNGLLGLLVTEIDPDGRPETPVRVTFE
jgi:hypothetical protein